MSEETKKKERHNPLRIFKNVVFLFRYLFRYAPGSVVLTVVNSVLGAGLRILGNVVFVKYVFDAIESGAPFREIALMASLLVAAHLVLSFVN